MAFPPGHAHADENVQQGNHLLTLKDRVADIVNHPAFKGFSELLLPWDDNTKYYNTRLDQVGTLMPYHSHVDGNEVVGALNYLITQADSGKTIFYDFYSERQKKEDPTRKATGLFFFRGNPGATFAIVCPGGGFKYVGSLHEGFPLAQEISRKGLNAFVIRYRVDEQLATEDLASAVSYVFKNAKSLGVATHGYSLWGASAGGRMVGNIALRGVSNYGDADLPKPATVVITYTGQTGSSKDFPPAFMAVSTDDPIVNIHTMDKRVQDLRNDGVEVEYLHFKNAGHGFGMGRNSDAAGWIERAIAFWQRHLPDAKTTNTTAANQPKP